MFIVASRSLSFPTLLAPDAFSRERSLFRARACVSAAEVQQALTCVPAILCVPPRVSEFFVTR